MKDAITKKSELGRGTTTMVTQLQDSLTKVLSGFIPICANCKRIGDDNGSWNPIEGYIQGHTDARFSHGVCPECMMMLYPDYLKNT